MSTIYEGETNVIFPDEEPLRAVPSAELRLLIDNLFANKLREDGTTATYIEANEIPNDVLNHLNAFASWAAQTPTKLVVIHRCSSCYVDNEPGNLATMEDGLEQCWKC